VFAASLVLDSFERFWHGLIDRLPSILAALTVFFAFYLAARLFRSGARRALSRLSTTAHVDVLLSRLISYAIMLAGFIIALSLLGINLGVLIASLGLLSVGLGFAVRDIVANFLAGVILILQKPFKVGDSVVVGGMEGTVEDLRIRDTVLRCPDGRLVFMPNSNIFTAAITNNTASGRRRSEFVVPVPFDESCEGVIERVRAVLLEVEGVLQDPPPRIGAEEIKDGALQVKVGYWTEPSTDTFRVTTEALMRLRKDLPACDG
jgi:small conductance mechanosensitive channel